MILQLRKIVRSVRSSPQRRQNWFVEVARTSPGKPALMLILDVKTRWSSTHQMLREFVLLNQTNLIPCFLGRALDYRQSVHSFVHSHTDLWPQLLSDEEWHTIDLVTTWLKSFRSATTQMSATRTPMLSTTHAIFRGLQEELCNTIRSLPKGTTSPRLIKGLTDAHRKLSDYYHTFDESPFYIWSSRKLNIYNSGIV
jgi:hypothetical protein